MKYYIFSPYFSAGGVESLHGLCETLNGIGADAYIVYEGVKFDIEILYKKYYEKVKSTRQIEDKYQNVIIFPEIYTKEYVLSHLNLKNIRCAVWWLSVENARIFKSYDSLMNSYDIVHLYASQYAKDAIRIEGLLVGDFIRSEISDLVRSHPVDKRNLVCFSGHDKVAPLLHDLGIDTLPLSGMTWEDSIRAMSECKVYIDFTNQVGRERFPREASLSGCVVVSGRSGTAGNSVDLPIEEKVDDLQSAGKLISDIFQNYDVYFSKQLGYRDSLYMERHKVVGEVRVLDMYLNDYGLCCDMGVNINRFAELVGGYSDSIFVDLGVRRGFSSWLMLRGSMDRGNVVYGVDIDFSGADRVVMTHPRYRPITGDSCSVGASWDGGEISVLFVDNLHVKEQVLVELYYWYGHVREGGTIAFHDSAWPEGKCENFGGRNWGCIDEAIRGFFGIDSLEYEDDYISVTHSPDSWGMTFVRIKKRRDYVSMFGDWGGVFNQRNLLTSIFWNEETVGGRKIDLILP